MSQPQPQADTNLDLKVKETIEMSVQKEEEKSKYFFIRRVPFRHMEREWQRPPEAAYQKELLDQGFISAALIQGPISPELEADVRELEQHLLPHFWRMNQEAKFFQNRYYQYQWIFILAAFATTTLAAISVLMYAQDWQTGYNTHTFLGTIKPTEILGFLTAVISGMAATVSFLDANQTPQSRWFKARAQAESLRSLYFLYLARQNPFNLDTGRSRVQKLRRKVLDVLVDSPGADQMAALGTSGSFRAATSTDASDSSTETDPSSDN